ncbi:hypothetical protein NNX28_11995 [Arthrobacter sp. zg-Y859]|uniref:Rv2175c C-terminal domain-containing protein n=1 Tax=Arthrobacter jinronghuae TaxID=2964609 RepID=A0ABT1NSD4_9MICC|nr:hypothetical protein [Arthrobacter jinronghuae]MCQ1950643.1 hypothetical protein [Arthrobacter jinronghuae]UWX79121.1 hypothetical protein N2K98_02590 [Arthrobacter jinronghuae]
MSDRETQRHSSIPPRQAPASAPTPGPSRSPGTADTAGPETQWQAMEREDGLYTVAQIAQQLGFGGGPNSMARQLTGKGRILVVKRGEQFLYPGFQFDWGSERVLPTVKDVVRMGRQAGWADERIALWFYTSNRCLSHKRPVDVRANEEELIALAGEEFGQ